MDQGVQTIILSLLAGVGAVCFTVIGWGVLQIFKRKMSGKDTKAP